LGNRFATFPVAHELAIAGPADGFEVGFFNRFGQFFVQRLATGIGLAAQTVGIVGLGQALDIHMGLGAERGFDDLIGDLVQLSHAGQVGTANQCQGSHGQTGQAGFVVHGVFQFSA
jgi:hypothetical protein